MNAAAAPAIWGGRCFFERSLRQHAEIPYYFGLQIFSAIYAYSFAIKLREPVLFQIKK
jgi:hypothetical protein